MSITEYAGDIQPETRTLKELAAVRFKQRRQHYDGTRRRTVLLLPEPGCDEWPSALLSDGVLQPVDKVVLLLAMTIARQAEDGGYLPTQTTLATMANVSSPDTVWRALSILRCTRWLVACQRKYCKGGATEPCAYVVYSRPLPFTDVLYLDPDYETFLQKSVNHCHARVRALASHVLSQLPDHIRSGHTEGLRQPALKISSVITV